MKGFSNSNRADLEKIKLERTIEDLKNEFSRNEQVLKAQFEASKNEMRILFQSELDSLKQENQTLSKQLEIKEGFINELTTSNDVTEKHFKEQLALSKEQIEELEKELVAAQNKKRTFSDMESPLPASSTLQSLALENKVRELQHQVDIYREASKMLPRFRSELEKLVSVESERDKLKMIIERFNAESEQVETQDTEKDSKVSTNLGDKKSHLL